jgi:hypothetical protein
MSEYITYMVVETKPDGTENQMKTYRKKGGARSGFKTSWWGVMARERMKKGAKFEIVTLRVKAEEVEREAL